MYITPILALLLVATSRLGAAAPVPGCTSVASSIHLKTCTDVLAHSGTAGAKALLLLNPDLDCSLAIEPNTPICIQAKGYGTSLLDITVLDYYMYFMNDDMSTHSNALAACQSMGGDLVSIHTAPENEAALQLGSTFLDKIPMFFGDRLKMAWIGVQVQTSGTVTNTDGSYVGYENWAGLHRPGPSDSTQCVHMNMTSGEWSSNVACASRLYFMCKRLATPTVSEVAARGWNMSGIPTGAELEAMMAAGAVHAQKQKEKAMGLGIGLGLPAFVALLVAAGVAYRYRRTLSQRLRDFKDRRQLLRPTPMLLRHSSGLSASAGDQQQPGGGLLDRLRHRGGERGGSSRRLGDEEKSDAEKCDVEAAAGGGEGGRRLRDAGTNTRISIPPGYVANNKL